VSDGTLAQPVAFMCQGMRAGDDVSCATHACEREQGHAGEHECHCGFRWPAMTQGEYDAAHEAIHVEFERKLAALPPERSRYDVEMWLMRQVHELDRHVAGVTGNPDSEGGCMNETTGGTTERFASRRGLPGTPEAGFALPDLVSWLFGGWTCILAAGAFVVALSNGTVLPEIERPYIECDGVPFYGSLWECTIDRGGRHAAIIWWQAMNPTDHSAINEHGQAHIGGRWVPVAPDRIRPAIKSVINHDEPIPGRFRGERIRRRNAGRRMSTYRLVRSGVFAAWCRRAREMNGW